MPNVLVVGDANVDIVVPYPVFLNAERTRVKYPQPEVHGGGTAANTAVALAKLGVKTTFVGTVGDDQYGRLIREELEASGVDASGLVTDPDLNTVGVFAFVDEFGERYLWGWPRVDQSFKVLDPGAVSAELLAGSDWVHSSGMAMTYPTSARDTIIATFKAAHEAGITTSFDLNCRCDDRDLDADFKVALREIISYTTYLFGSGPDELEHFSGGGWRQAAAELATVGRTVVARDGANGSTAFTPEGESAAAAFAVEVADTIGAGDVYNAGFIAATLERLSLPDALTMANAVSAYTVSRTGSQNSPTRSELDAFLSTHTNN